MSPNPDDATLRTIFDRTRRIAVVGASNRPDRPSYHVMLFLRDQGFAVAAVNPALDVPAIDGIPVYPSLAAVPGPLDMIDIFRNSAAAGAAVDDALALSPLPETIWMQLGVVNEAAATRARAQGVDVVMDRCPAIEMPRLRLTR